MPRLPDTSADLARRRSLAPVMDVDVTSGMSLQDLHGQSLVFLVPDTNPEQHSPVFELVGVIVLVGLPGAAREQDAQNRRRGAADGDDGDGGGKRARGSEHGPQRDHRANVEKAA